MSNPLSDIIKRLISDQEKRIALSLKNMVINPESKDHGGIIWAGSGLTNISWHDCGSCPFIPRALSLWMASDSKYHKDKELLSKIELAVDFMEANLPASGLLSMSFTNYSSPADTGFALFGYGPVLFQFRKEKDPVALKFLPKLEKYVERIGKPLIGGGVHTPNHRWSNVSSLGWLWKLFGWEDAKSSALEWLKEGIDTTEYGEFMERSMNYGNHCSRSLISAAISLEMPELLEGPQLHLKNLPYLVHPGGLCVTDYSDRNDRGNDFFLDHYLESALMMHSQLPSPNTSMLVKECFSLWEEEAVEEETIVPPNADMLGWLQYLDFEKFSWPEPEIWPDEYIKEFSDKEMQKQRMSIAKDIYVPYASKLTEWLSHGNQGAPIVRIRHKELSATIMSWHPSVLSMRYGSARILGISVCLSYFGRGEVPAQEIKKEGEVWVLSNKLQGKFYGPMGEKLPNGHMKHKERPALNLNHLNWKLNIEEIDKGFDLELDASGAIEESGDEQRVMAQIIFHFPIGGSIKGEGLIQSDQLPNLNRQGYIGQSGENDYYLKSGEAIYKNGKEGFRISGAAMQHQMERVPREWADAGEQSLRINLVCPVRHKFRVKCISL